MIGERTAQGGADPVLQLTRGQQAGGFDDAPLAKDPFRFDGVEPRTLGRQEYEWLAKGKPIRTLLVDLGTIGRAAGAIVPYVRPRPEGTVEFGETVNSNFDWDEAIDLRPDARYLDYDTYRRSGLISRASFVMGSQEIRSAAALRGADAFYETWVYLDWLKDHRPNMRDVADRACDRFIDCAAKAGAVRVDRQGVPDSDREFDWGTARITLHADFWDAYLQLTMQ